MRKLKITWTAACAALAAIMVIGAIGNIAEPRSSLAALLFAAMFGFAAAAPWVLARKTAAAVAAGLLVAGGVAAPDDGTPRDRRDDLAAEAGDQGQVEAATTTTDLVTTEAPTSTTSPEGADRSGIVDDEDLPAGPGAPTAGTNADRRQPRPGFDSLHVEAEHRDGYDRDAWAHWDDEDGDRCDTRCEVLRSERQPDGTWFSLWDGETVTESRQLHVDHIVALAEAHDSGGHAWSESERDRFADDMDNLIGVSAASNIRKSAKDAAEWQPSHRPGVCPFVRITVTVKLKYDLSVDAAEKKALVNLWDANDCDGTHTPPTTTTTTTTTTTRPAPTTTTAPPPPPPTTAAPTTTTAPSNGGTATGSGDARNGQFCSTAHEGKTDEAGNSRCQRTNSCTGKTYDKPRWVKVGC